MVEDNVTAIKATLLFLESFQCEVDVAMTGSQALEFTVNHNYDLILLDIGLPDEDGYSIGKKIRAWEKIQGKTHTPIFAITAHSDDYYVNRCKEAGIDESFSKPLLQEHKSLILERLAATIAARQQQPLAVIDWPLAVKLAGGDVAHAKAMLQLLVEELSTDKPKMMKAYTTGKLDELRNLVHRLHGALCYVGAPALKRAAYECEKALVAHADSAVKFQQLMQATDELAVAFSHLK